MTRRTNARVAGYAFLIYIAAGITSLILSGKATVGTGIPAKLANIAQHSAEMGLVVVLSLVASFCALTLGVTLYALTREQDAEVAMLGMVCRVVEGVVAGAPTAPALRWLANAAATNALEPATTQVLGTYLFMPGGSTSAIFFAVGSTLFCWLFLRGRMIPRVLAWLGVFASVLLVVVLPLQLAGFLGGDASWFGWLTWAQWMPMLVFEVWLALVLILKGVAMPAAATAVS